MGVWPDSKIVPRVRRRPTIILALAAILVQNVDIWDGNYNIRGSYANMTDIGGDPLNIYNRSKHICVFA